MKNDSSKSSDPVNEDETKMSSLTSVVIDEEERRAKQKESEIRILVKFSEIDSKIQDLKEIMRQSGSWTTGATI